MKITNITNLKNKISQEVKIPLVKKGGTTINVTLKPGDYVFTDKNVNNNVLRIYEKKNFIKITQETPENNQSYYSIYNIKDLESEIKSNETKQIEHENILLENQTTTEESFFDEEHTLNLVLDSMIEEMEENGELNDVIDNSVESEKEIIEFEIIVPEDSLKEVNKGGRPKGSKNKPKRGRPKTKKTSSRARKAKR